MSEAILCVRKLEYTYEGAKQAAVRDVDLTVEKGEFVAVLGRNGSGKSTLARLLNGLLLPSRGENFVNGMKLDEDSAFDVRRCCGMVFQNPDNQIVASVVEEDCAFGVENLGIPSPEIRRRVDEALEAVGMSAYKLTAPSMLSGGQKQRVAIAGVLAMQPEMIIFDESTAMLDPVGRNEIYAIAKQLNKERGTTILWITHFMQEAAAADRVLIMGEGRIQLSGTPREVFTNVDQIMALGLDVPEMMKLSKELREAGLNVPADTMNVEEMTRACCG